MLLEMGTKIFFGRLIDSYKLPHGEENKAGNNLDGSDLLGNSLQTGACPCQAGHWSRQLEFVSHNCLNLLDLLPGGRAVLKGCVLSLKCLRNSRLVLCPYVGPVDGDGYVDRLAVDSVQVAD
jgi:hypothetical protein